MKKFVIVTASILGVGGAAVAADLPVRQPVPPAPAAGPFSGFPLIGKGPVGKAPIGKGPIGKGPVGKGPVGKGPVVAPAVVAPGAAPGGGIATRG
jgi:hypothetical protein